MVRTAAITALVCLLFIGLKLFGSTAGSEEFGSTGAKIVKEVLDSALSGYNLQFEQISWSGTGSTDEFSEDGSVIVLDAAVATIAEKLEVELVELPAQQGWNDHGFGVTGDRLYQINYVERGDQFYIDFILTQVEEDVEVRVLYKGVRR